MVYLTLLLNNLSSVQLRYKLFDMNFFFRKKNVYIKPRRETNFSFFFFAIPIPNVVLPKMIITKDFKELAILL